MLSRGPRDKVESQVDGKTISRFAIVNAPGPIGVQKGLQFKRGYFDISNP